MHQAALHVAGPPVNVRAMRHPLSGLYVITRPLPGAAGTLAEAVSEAIAGGARLIQYRDKSESTRRRREEAGAVMEVCREKGVPLIVNDDVELAATVGADGAHLGERDDAPGRARAALGPNAIIGVSCYNELERARRAVADGASYVAFGSFFPSPTKPNAVTAPPGLLRDARRELDVPVCAIGGITPENGAGLIAAGADMLAVLSGVFEAVSVREAACRYARLFESNNESEGAGT